MLSFYANDLSPDMIVVRFGLPHISPGCMPFGKGERSARHIRRSYIPQLFFSSSLVVLEDCVAEEQKILNAPGRPTKIIGSMYVQFGRPSCSGSVIWIPRSGFLDTTRGLYLLEEEEECAQHMPCPICHSRSHCKGEDFEEEETTKRK